MNVVIDVPEEIVMGFDALKAKLSKPKQEGRKATDEETKQALEILETDGIKAANAFLKSINSPTNAGRTVSRRSLMVEALRIGLAELEARHADSKPLKK